MNGVREDLLSYKLPILRAIVAVCCLLFTFMSTTWMEHAGIILPDGYGLLCGAAFIIGLVFGFQALMESAYTFTNKQLQKLNRMNIDEIRSVRKESIVFFSVLKKNNKAFCILKNEVDVFRIGAETIYKGRYAGIDYKYYYIDEIKNRRIERVKYRDYQEFKRAVNQLNGNREVFDVVSINKIITPRKAFLK